MTKPLFLTLTTDFGTQDGFAGAVRGRILSIVPQAQLHDITHEISPQNVMQGAWALRRAAGHYPAGTVHLAVVDPGVGSERRGLVIQTRRYLFVGPDNGLLSLAAEDDGIQRVFSIQPAEGLGQKSNTFDGIHLFAPVAAHLLMGLDPAQTGDEIKDWFVLEEEIPWGRGVELFGRLLYFDRFGNGFTNISREAINRMEIARVYLRPTYPAQPEVEAVFCTHYDEIPEDGQVGALFNSDGRLELAFKSASLQARLGLKGEEQVRVVYKPRK